jgi:4-amino-4-deoxy-L-arabinose transferase-like glycosyltransferase
VKPTRTTRSSEEAAERAGPREGRAGVEASPSKAVYGLLLLAALIVLGTGLVLPDLVVGDSAQDAVMAMRMYFENDWVHLVKNGQDYLDKPHLLFWSAMVGYELFGVHEWSYRLVSVLVTLLGAWATFGLGRRLYDHTVGKIAAVMFLTSYATVLGNHDVRMDALLTGFVAFGLWQLVTYLDTDDWRSLVLGAAGIGLAFSAKGMVAVAVSGAVLLFHVWGRKQWRRLWSWKTGLGIAAFLVTISPVVYCYHVQFGLPGVKFILFGQTVERFGGGKGARHSLDKLFLYHSVLWAFLPWSLLTFVAWFHRFRALARGRWRAFHAQEQLTFLGVFVSIALLNLSRYQLAHYLNVFLPLLAIFTSGWLVELYRDARWRTLARLRAMQHVLIVLLLAALLVVNGWAFPPRHGWIVAVALVFGGALALAFRLKDRLDSVWVPSAVAISLVSVVMNANYYPWLGRYQLGDDEAAQLAELDLDWDRTYFLEQFSNPIQFYSRRVIPRVDLAQLRRELAAHDKVFLIVWEEGRAQVREAGLVHEVRLQFEDCRVTRLKPRVLNPRTRQQFCKPVYLLEVGG